MSKENSTTRKPYYPDSYTLKDFWRRKLRQGYSREYIQGWIDTLINNGFWNPERE